MHFTYGRRSIFPWRRCDTLRTSGFMGDVIFARDHMGHVDTVEASDVLRRRAWVNDPAVSYWLRSRVGDSGRRDYRRVHREMGAGAQPVMHSWLLIDTARILCKRVYVTVRCLSVRPSVCPIY